MQTISHYLNFSVVTASEVVEHMHIKRDKVDFNCQATGDPIPTVIWYFHDALVNKSSKYHISNKIMNYTSTSNTLTVKNVESSDVGTYTCHATNGVSTALSYGVLSMNGKLRITNCNIRACFMNNISKKIGKLGYVPCNY